MKIGILGMWAAIVCLGIFSQEVDSVGLGWMVAIGLLVTYGAEGEN